MRDITLEDTFRHQFTARAFATGIPGTLGGTPVLSVLEENNATPITAGVSVSVDRASVAGLNEVTVVATAANGYENLKSYGIYISTGTVGGVSVVGEVVHNFTIGLGAAAVDLANGTDGLGAIKTVVDAIPTTAMRGTDSAALASVCTEGRLAELDAANLPADMDATLADTNELQTDWVNGGRLDLILDIIAADTTTDIPALIAALNNLSAANVNAEVLDVMNVDTVTLPGQEAPPLAPTMRQMQAWLYKVFRNRTTQTGGIWKLFANDETTVDAKATVSDDTTTAIKQEVESGP